MRERNPQIQDIFWGWNNELGDVLNEWDNKKVQFKDDCQILGLNECVDVMALTNVEEVEEKQVSGERWQVPKTTLRFRDSL